MIGSAAVRVNEITGFFDDFQSFFPTTTMRNRFQTRDIKISDMSGWQESGVVLAPQKLGGGNTA
jgi:hypothetical protein